MPDSSTRSCRRRTFAFAATLALLMTASLAFQADPPEPGGARVTVRLIPHASAVLNGNVPKEIVRHAEAQGCDLIMIGTQTCKGVEKALFGSVTERVIKTANCPVLSMNPCI